MHLISYKGKYPGAKSEGEIKTRVVILGMICHLRKPKDFSPKHPEGKSEGSSITNGHLRRRLSGETALEIASEDFSEYFRVDQKYDLWV